jgi:hypothetical protein
MSAQLMPVEPDQQTEHAPKRSRVKLRAVAPQEAVKSRMPFAIMLSVLLILGMAGVVFLSTIVQSQSMQISSMKSQLNTLDTEYESLQVQVDQKRAAPQLTQQALALGMVPNLTPAQLDLVDGTITGQLVPAVADPLPNQAASGNVSEPQLPQIKVLPVTNSSANNASSANNTSTDGTNH